MAYGLQVFNENDQTLIDTDLASQMQVSSIGSIAGRTGTSPNYSYSSITKDDEELVCFNSGITTGSVTTAFNQAYSNNNIINLSASSFNYAKLSVVTQTYTGSGNADYGITIFNPSSTISFTDAFDKSYDLLAVHPAGTLYGQGAVIYSGSDFSDIYVGSGPPKNDSSVKVNNYAFDAANNQILYYNYLFVGAPGFNQTYYFYNPSNVFVARLRNLT